MRWHYASKYQAKGNNIKQCEKRVKERALKYPRWDNIKSRIRRRPNEEEQFSKKEHIYLMVYGLDALVSQELQYVMLP